MIKKIQSRCLNLQYASGSPRVMGRQDASHFGIFDASVVSVVSANKVVAGWAAVSKNHLKISPQKKRRRERDFFLALRDFCVSA